MEDQLLEIDRGSEKSFGLVFATVFFLIGVYNTWGTGTFSWWAFAVAAILLVISFLEPALLKIPNYWWFKLGLGLGRIVSPVIMALVYITTLVPMGVIIKLLGKDILHLKLDAKSDSYWIQRKVPPQSMKHQF